MKKINETARSLDVILETDVLVVGSGPGGLAAALAAARAGARTALIDRNGCFGGNITQVGVEGFAWYRHEHTVDCEGIGIEFEERAKALGAASPEPQSLSHALDAEMFKWVADRSGNGEWDYETTGKEDQLFSPFLRKPFKQALAAGIIPPNLKTIAGTWGTVTDQGDLTYLNLVHVPEIDGTDPADLTTGEMRGRREAIYALEALRGFMPGCAHAKLRNFGMTLGVRDTRKIDALYNLTGTDVREQARFDDAIGIFPEFIDGYGILILPTTGRYWHVPYRALVPKGVGNLLVAGRCIGGDKISHASARNMMCCAVSGQGAGTAAAVSLQRGEALDQVNIGAVQAELARQGARFR